MSAFVIIALYLLGIAALICETDKQVRFPLAVFFAIWPIAALISVVWGAVAMIAAAVRK